jgi:hypothetical protein
VGDPNTIRQIARTPMRRRAGRRFERQGHNPRGLPFRDPGRSARSRRILEAGDPRLRKAATDATHLQQNAAANSRERVRMTSVGRCFRTGPIAAKRTAVRGSARAARRAGR